MNIGRGLLILILVIGSERASIASLNDFSRVLTDAKALDGKRVTLKGVVDLYSYGFFLCANATPKGEPDLSKSVFVVGDIAQHLPDKMNRHWVSVTGIVDAAAHGPWGEQPCQIKVEGVKPLTVPPLEEHGTFGIFRNETASTLTVKISGPNGYRTSDLAPGDIIIDGIDDKNEAVANDAAGNMVARYNLVDRPTGRYFDSSNRTYYFRITDHRFERVLPADGRQWKVPKTKKRL
jgi:hypothetical protein